MVSEDDQKVKIMWECTSCDKQWVDAQNPIFCYWCHQETVVFLCNWDEQLFLFRDESAIC